jgi:putative membrane protein
MAVIAFSGWDGFLGTRASLAIDAVCLGMVLVVLVLGWSIRQVGVHRRYALHRRVQLGLAGLLLVVLTAFEIDVRFNGWTDRAAGEIGGQPAREVFIALWIHLFFAVTTVVLWILVIVLAVKRFSNPPEPNSHSMFHRRWGKIAALDMLFTTVTGWIFYFLAFI